MKGLKGLKMCTFLGLAAVLAAAVFMLQVETVSPGAPAVCEEPCGDETAAAEVPGGPVPGPLVGPFDPVGVQTVTGPVVAPLGPVKARAPAGGGEGAELPVLTDNPGTPGDGAPAPVPVQEAEAEPLTAAVERQAAVDGPTPVEDRPREDAALPKDRGAESLPESDEEAAFPREHESTVARHERSAAAITAEPPHFVEPAAESQLLPVRLRVPAPRGGTRVARGALGYRVPLVVRHRVPAQIRGGVFIPAHETYVVLQPGYWEPEDAGQDPPGVGVPAEAPEAAGGRWLRRLFGKPGRGGDGGS